MKEKYEFEKDLPYEEFEGNVAIKNIKSIYNEDFKLEKDLTEYIVINIEKFTKDLFDDIVMSFEINKAVKKNIRFAPSGRRIDLYIVGDKKTYIIELKNPNSSTESRGAIGQILDYGREFTNIDKELVIVTTSFDINTAKTIKYYNLPIRYIYISKKRFLEYESDCDE